MLTPTELECAREYIDGIRDPIKREFAERYLNERRGLGPVGEAFLASFRLDSRTVRAVRLVIDSYFDQ